MIDFFSSVEGYSLDYSKNIENYVIYILLAIIPSFFLPLKHKKPSTLILWILYFCHIVPTIILIPIILQSNFLWGFTIVLFFTLVIILSKLSFGKCFDINKYLNFNNNIFFIFLFFIAVTSLLIIIYIYGISFNLPNITDVYSVRENFIENSNVISSYTSIIAGYTICPILLLIGINLLKNKPFISTLFIIISLVMSIQIYANSGLKSVAFTSFSCLIFYFIFKYIKNLGIFFAISIPIVFILLIGIYNIFDFHKLEIVLYHWFRRVFIVPGMNVNYVFDYMLNQNLQSLKDSPLIISEYYYGTSGSANSGLVGDAFSRVSYLGFFINGLILLCILKLSNYVIPENSNIGLSLMIPISYALSNSSITTIFITYGYFLIVLIFIFFRKNINEIEFRNLK